MDFAELLNAYRGKRVLITGHTGFKGSWLSLILQLAGAEVTGYALPPNTSPALFDLSGAADGMRSVTGDIRELESLRTAFWEARPEIVFHLAAQPIVLEGYRHPVETYETNVMGTVHLLECVRGCDSVRSVLNVTTDKVYQNPENGNAFTESDRLDGYDPYSNSKSCSELVTHSYRNSFLRDRDVRVSTARAGNVIGGGDFERDRIVPDCVRAALAGNSIRVRNPDSVRPYQHVLEPLFAYLLIACAQITDASVQGAYNIGPNEEDCWTTGRLAETFCGLWGEGAAWKSEAHDGPHEAGLLRLDCAKMKRIFCWEPLWDAETAMEKVVDWTKTYRDGGDVRACMERQIQEYIQESKA